MAESAFQPSRPRAGRLERFDRGRTGHVARPLGLAVLDNRGEVGKRHRGLWPGDVRGVGVVQGKTLYREVWYPDSAIAPYVK